MDYNFTKYREPRPALKIKKDKNNQPKITTTRRSIDSSRTLVDPSSSSNTTTNSASEKADKEGQLEQEQHDSTKSKSKSPSSSKLSDKLKLW